MTVSVVIPLYDAEAYVGRCLDSVLSQSCNDIEIIVVDDCSTDGSVAVVEQYCGRHSNIRLIRHDRNRGPMTSRRDGYEAATGDYLMFVDSDDTLPQCAVVNLLTRQQATDADIVVGEVLKHDGDGATEVLSPGNTGESKMEFISAVIEHKVVSQLWGKLFRSRLFKNDGLQTFDGMTCAEDECLFYQLVSKSEKIVFHDGIVYEYFQRTNSLSRRVYRKRDAEFIICAYRMMQTLFDQYAELHDKLQRQLTFTAFRLYFDRVGIATVRRLLRKYGMQRYGSLRYAGKYLEVRDYWFFAKRYVYVRTVLRKL